MKSAKMNFVNYVKRFAIAVVLSGWLVSIAPQASAQAKGWAVGNEGTMLYSDNAADVKAWKPVVLPDATKADLKAVASSPDGKTAWAVGNSPKPGQGGVPGTILYFDGTIKDKKQVWVLQDTDDKGKQLALGDLYGVFALDSTRAWIVGQGGTIFFTNSAGKKGWQKQDFPRGVANDLYGVFFTQTKGSYYGWAVGDKGTILYYNGDQWVRAAGDFPKNSKAKFTSVSGYTVGENEKKMVYLTAVGDKALGIWKCQGLAKNNVTWTKAQGKEGMLKDRQDLKVVQVASAKIRWVGQTGSPDNVYQWNGTEWFPQPTGKFNDVYGLSVSADGNSAWAVGEDGNIAYSGTKKDKNGMFTWTVNDPVPKKQLNGIVIRPGPKQQVKLEQSASPDSGAADVNYVSVAGSDFPAGDINAANVVVELASTCHGHASATTSAVSIVSGSGDSQLISFLLPAGLDPGQYFISISDSEEGDANFESSNCAVVNVVQ